jgi:DNA polymerase
MAMTYDELLEATIQHLQGLKARGVRHVPVRPETLQPPGNRLSAVSRPAGSPALEPAAARQTPEVSARTQAEPFASPEAPDSLDLIASPTRTGIRPGPTQAPLIASEPPESRPGSDRPATANLTPEAKALALNQLRERALVCLRCPHLVRSRKSVVFGVGDPNARLMFVGEAPGADEDAQGEPFVGAAGQLLTKIIQAMGLVRQAVYIANILKCRPDTPGQAFGNRKPTAEEMQTCVTWLHEQIDLIQPEVLVGLGATAIEGLLGKTLGITKLRGRWQTYRAMPLMPTYHPAYLLRNQAMSEKRKVWEDMLQVMERLELPISEKQRNYFMRPLG